MPHDTTLCHTMLLYGSLCHLLSPTPTNTQLWFVCHPHTQLAYQWGWLSCHTSGSHSTTFGATAQHCVYFRKKAFYLQTVSPFSNRHSSWQSVHVWPAYSDSTPTARKSTGMTELSHLNLASHMAFRNTGLEPQICSNILFTLHLHVWPAPECPQIRQDNIAVTVLAYQAPILTPEQQQHTATH